MKRIFVFLFFCTLLACQNGTSPDTAAEEEKSSLASDSKIKIIDTGFVNPYDLKNPTATFKLPGKLTEISGLSISKDDQSLLAVNDEKGKIFFISKHSGEVTADQKFHTNGDYEGIEMVGDTIYVVKSNGTIYQIKGIGKVDAETQVFKTELKTANNIEGLGYDANKNRLLLASKGKAGIKEALEGQKVIFAFDLNTKKLDPKPAFTISRATIKKYVQQHSDRTEKFLKILAPDQAADAIGPSGVAIHPLTKHIYVISSLGKLFLVLDASGQIIHIEKLDKDLHKQPEGICFDQLGNLYISTEGRNGKGKIYHFAMK